MPARCAISRASPREWWLSVSSPSLMTTRTRRTSLLVLVSGAVLEEIGARLIDGVVESRGAAGALPLDDVAQQVQVAGEILDDLGLVVDGHQEGLVLAPANHIEQKIDGRLLLELQALANAIGSVEQQADAQGQVGLAG